MIRPSRVWCAAGTAVLVLLLPVWGFELAYICFRPGDGFPPVPEAQGSELMADALWLSIGESLGSEVTPIWAGNLFDVAPASPGRSAAMEVAHLRVAADKKFRLRPGRGFPEAALAVWLSRHATEAELKRYLAAWGWFGHGATGVAAAAEVYFGKSAASLTHGETALLAGLLCSARFDPCLFRDGAVKRRAHLLTRLRAAGRLRADEETAANAEAITLAPSACSTRTTGR